MEADGFVTVTDNGRGIPVDPHPKFKNKSALEVIMCTLHAGGKFDSEGLRDLRRPARRRRLGRQRAVGAHGSRGRARADALPHGVRARQAEGQAGKGRPRAEPARHQGALPARPGDLRRQGAFQAGAPLQDGALQGLSVRRRRNPLVLRARSCCTASRTCRRRRPSISPTGSRIISPRQLERRDAGASRHLHRQCRQDRRPRRGEWAVAWTADADGFLTSYCNTIPTPDGGTHESGLRTALLRGLKDHAERIGQGKRAAAITSDDVMTGAGCMLSVFIREPEFQGQTKDRLATAEAHAHRRERDPGPVRPLARRQSDAGQQAARLRHRARRRAHPPPPGKGDLAQDRGAQAAPARQARRLHQHRPRKARRSSSSRATAPAARPSRRATAPRRRCCRCAARSSTSPPPARTSWRRTSSSPI